MALISSDLSEDVCGRQSVDVSSGELGVVLLHDWLSTVGSQFIPILELCFQLIHVSSNPLPEGSCVHSTPLVSLIALGGISLLVGDQNREGSMESRKNII